MCCQVYGKCWNQGSETLRLAEWVLHKAVVGTQVDHRSLGMSWRGEIKDNKDNNTQHEPASKPSVL